MRIVEENCKVLASLLPVGWQQAASAVTAVERLFRTYFASLTLSLIHVIARVAAGSPKVLIASIAT